MRRTRFAGAIERKSGSRASIREALSFDILSPEVSDGGSLSAWRVAALDHSAVLLGITHLVAALALLSLHPEHSFSMSFANPLIPMSLLLALDVGAALLPTPQASRCW